MLSSLLLLVVGAVVLPLDVFVVLLLLRSRRGVVTAAAFAAGAMAVRVLQGVLFGYVFGTAMDADAHDVLVSTLLLVVGILSLITAVKAWFKEVDPDAPPSTWMKRLGGVSAATAFGMGALLMAIGIKQWVFTLSAIATIDDAHLGWTGNALVYFAFIVAAHSLVLAPIVLCTAAPARAATVLDWLQGWLARNGRVTMLLVSLVLGVWFLFKGISGFLRDDHREIAFFGISH
jgi:hypothetical protein